MWPKSPDKCDLDAGVGGHGGGLDGGHGGTLDGGYGAGDLGRVYGAGDLDGVG